MAAAAMSSVVPPPAVAAPPRRRSMDFQRSLSRILPSPDRLAQVKQFTQGASDEGVDPGITGARDSKQLKPRQRLHLMLENPRSSMTARMYIVLIILTIFTSVINFFLNTLPELEDSGEVRAVEIMCTTIFLGEALLRTYVGTLDPKRMILKDYWYWIDWICILPFFIEAFVSSSGGANSEVADALQVLQLLRLLRILKLMRHYPDWRVLFIALNNSGRALIVPIFAMAIVILILAGALFLVGRATDEEGEAGFDNGFETMWVCFWLVATLGYDGYLGNNHPGSRLIIAFALMMGLLFTTMPITIIGEAFRAAWEKKELVEVQMKIQNILQDRGLTLNQLHSIFSEFDTSGDMQLDWGEFKAALKKLGVKVPVSKMRQLFSMFDEDETGEVDYYEFCRLLYPNMDIDTTAMDAVANGQPSEGGLAEPSEGGPAPAGGGGIPPPTKKFKLAGGQGLVKMKTMAALTELQAASQAGLCGQGLLSEIGSSAAPSPSGWARSRVVDGAGAAAPLASIGSSPGAAVGGVRERLAALKAAKEAAKSAENSSPTGTGAADGTAASSPGPAPGADHAKGTSSTSSERRGQAGDGSVSPVEPFAKAGES
jgi:hypothetical protein